MKIAIVVRRVSCSAGGVERVTVNLSKKLAEAGHNIYIFTNHSDTEIRGVNVTIIRGAGILGKVFSPWKLLSFQKEVMKEIKKNRFDIVYGLCPFFPVDIYRVGGGIHKYWMEIQYPNAIFRWVKYLTSLVHLTMVWLENKIFISSYCKFYVTNSQFMKNKVIEYFNIYEEKIKVIYNGVDYKTFNRGVKDYRKSMRDQHKIDDNELVLLFVGNDWKRKGLATVINAIPKTGIEKIRLVIVGRGNKGPYVSLMKHNKIQPSTLIFAGHSKNIEKYYGMADIFVFPSRYDPFSNVCLEGMACGLPVITTRTNGASELITNGENGFIVDDWRDAESIAHVIKRLSENGGYQEIGFRAAETAKEYTWEKHIEEITQLFMNLSTITH